MTRPTGRVGGSSAHEVDIEAAADPDRRAERRTWEELQDLVGRLTDAELVEPGYFAEGWSVRDMIGHIGAWQAEAGQLLEQMAAGTYVEGELDVDAANARFLELLRDIPLDTVLQQATASHHRMLAAWAELPDPRPQAADRWLMKAGTAHYEEHLPRLHDWVTELVARRLSPQ